MRDIDLKSVEHLAELSALSFTDEEKQQFILEFNNILNLINQIDQIDLEQELVYTNAVDVSQLREDQIKPSMPQELALINAPKQRKGCFRVPRVVD